MKDQLRAVCLMHEPFEGPGFFAEVLRDAGFGLRDIRVYAGDALPALEDFDFVLLMGGGMSVNDEAVLPWLAPEKAFIRSAIGAGKPVLGICLGAQLIASALGARVYRNAQKEIGWFPIEAVRALGDRIGASLDAAFPLSGPLEVFHWHGETFELPEGAELLAKSQACAHQAFRLGQRVCALQFHPEATPESVLALVGGCRSEIVHAPYIQPEADILAERPGRFEAMHALARAIVGGMIQGSHSCGKRAGVDRLTALGGTDPQAQAAPRDS